MSNGVRLLAMAGAAVGMFFTTVLIARLVAVYSTGAPARSP